MRLEVASTGYDSAADALLAANGVVASGYSTLTGALGGYAGMGGDDKSSEDFVANYDGAAAEAVTAIADLATACGTLAAVTSTSGANHRDADAGSVYGGSGASGNGGDLQPEAVAAYSPPSSLGADGGDMPEFWDLIVDHLQGWAWPSADTGRLRAAAGSWRSVATQVDRVSSHSQIAKDYLSAQASPEIPSATAAITDVSRAAGDLASACRTLAESCDEYAEKVDSTKETIKGLLRDLAIEIGATAVISGLASLVTFGGAAAVGAGVAVARAIACARKIIAALMAIKAIRAMVTLVRTVEKLTDVTTLLRRFRSARNMRRKPDSIKNLPAKGKPNSYGYDGKGNLLPYTNRRPPYANGQVDEVWDRQVGPDGKVTVLDHRDNPVDIRWNHGDPRNRVWDMGHTPGNEYWKLRDEFLSGKISEEQFLRRYQAPDNYRVEHWLRNRMHVDEQP